MTLPQIWSGYFQGDVRMRGRAFFLDGRVEQTPPQEGEYVRAEVRDGEGVCLVQIRLDQGPSRVRCSCHGGEGDAYCEHAWATLLDVQENGPLEPPVVEVESANGLVADASGRPRWPKARKREGNGEPVGMPARRQPGWLDQLNLLRPTMASLAEPRPILPRHRVVHYVVSPDLCREHGGLVVDLRQDDPSLRGGRRTRSLRLAIDRVTDLAQEIDRELCGMILGAQRVGMSEYDRPSTRERGPSAYRLPVGAQRQILRRMIETGRCWLEHGLDAWPLRWEGDEAWTMWLRGRSEGSSLVLTLELRRGNRTLGVHEPAVLLGGVDGLAIYRAPLSVAGGPAAGGAAVEDGGALRWASQFRDDHAMGGDRLVVPRADIPKFLEHLYMLPNLPELDLPAELAPEPVTARPAAHLELVGLSENAAAWSGEAGRKQVGARVWFAYGHQRVKPGTTGKYLTADVPVEPASESTEPAEQQDAPAAVAGPRRPVRRDTAFEQQALTELLDLGFAAGDASPEVLTLASGAVADAVETLLSRGWTVMAEQRVIRRASAPRFTITSGIDWFELRGELNYATAEGQETVSLPAVLAAAGSGKQFITLSDGTLGALPQEWLSGHELLTSLGKLAGDHLRFKSSQAALLDALLVSQPAEDIDGKFSQIRQELGQFDRIEPLPPAGTFQGELRVYQKEGLGWLAFLRRFGLGGILADDMGLGKTVQVLAMLDAWYGRLREGQPPAGVDHRPTLVVAPRSVVFNWVDEAKRFTPNLRVQAYAGTDRHGLREAFDRHDVIVTSYGLLRRDAAELRGTTFEYVVLDEAQAIKNPHSQGAKAARVIQSGHRLALTGTPVENHLGDLWSIFEFLNPGILGSSTRFAELMRGGVGTAMRPAAETPPAAEAATAEAIVEEEQERGRIKNQQVRIAWQAGRALRPFILRRTKKQVLSELPEKTEQTIVCEMDPAQRQIYDQLRDHYRHVLLRGGNGKGGAGDAPMPGGHGLLEGEDAARAGSAGSTSGGSGGGGAMLVLEALLRLRQAACHPALIDPSRTDVPSAKLDVLLEQVEELVEEGHKALVFSQFTSLLALVRPRLEERGLVYEYLDGKTRDREERVRRFQNDAQCPLFLVSLKAGGLGLNLTAADYVFLLDPWWNPAVEQQAIDRAHRIGQTRPVFAYRLVCQDTVEQRIQELQARKKEIAAAIVSSPENILRHLSRDDLERLLS